MKKTILTLIVLTLIAWGHAQTVEHVYHYQNPIVTEQDGYQQITFEGCLPFGQVGEPTLPWQNVSLILPQGMEAASVRVDFMDYVEIEGNFLLYPYQKPRPYSREEVVTFEKNETLYRSSTPYPVSKRSTVNTQYLNGVGLAFSGFTPMEYIPSTGIVRYAQTVKVTIEAISSRDDQSRKLWLTPENEASLKRLAQNEEQLDNYRRRGRELNGYDMLVITSEEWMSRFDEYISLYNGKGIRTRIVSLEQIYATMNGSDEQEQIRNYIIQEYENNGIQMVNLGGDISIVPFRFLWCWAQEGEEDQLPSDMYYACLDGTLNEDGDDRWGEVGEDDLLPEIGIGRLPFNNETQFNTIMHKTFSYLLHPILGEFTSPILGGEHLGDGYYGSIDMERIIGINSDFGYTTYGYPTDYNFKRHYATPDKSFSGGEFKHLIGTGGQYVHHLGHANTDIVAGWEGSAMGNDYFSGNNGIDHTFMLFHSHGCVCGDFSHTCVLEKMITISTGFVVTTGNSRYGWYVPWGDGMAAHIHREFVDAYYRDRIPTVGMALREAKIASAPWVTIDGENGCLRWNIYCLNVLGDAALYPWFEEPFIPNVVFENGLVAGSTSTTVHVSHFDTPLRNFQVSLFDGETLLARAFTDENGDAELVFNPALTTTGSMQLDVTGQSAWPQSFEVTGITSGEAFVYGDIIELGAPAEFGTTVSVSGDLYNKGNVAAHNIHATITSDCEYIHSNDSNFTIEEMASNSTMHFNQIGIIDIANNIPDQTIFTLTLTTSLNGVTNSTQKSLLALAPKMQFTDFVIEELEGNGNGYADPGERILLHVSGKNAGHALASDAFMTATCSNEHIQIEENRIPIGTIDIDGSFTTDLIFNADYDIREGTVCHFDLALHTGAYTTDYDYAQSIGIAVETFETGDFEFVDWFHSGDQPWFVTEDEAHSGIYCARSGAIDNLQKSRLIIYADIIDDGEISFWFKTSSEQGKDFFAFSIDGTRKEWWSGEHDWTPASYSFTAGRHEFEWLYQKNNKNEGGADCAWIDDITFPRTCTITNVEESIETAGALIYPNPCKESFQIELTQESDVIVYNMMGQQVASLSRVSDTQHIQLNSPGLYFVQIYNTSGVETLKVIAE